MEKLRFPLEIIDLSHKGTGYIFLGSPLSTACVKELKTEEGPK